LIFRPFDRAFAEAKGDMRAIDPVQLIRGKPYPRYYFATQIVPIRDRDDFVEKLASGRYSKQAAYVAETTAPLSASPGLVRRWRERTHSATIDVQTAGPAFLVLSVTPHKYWHLTVDGQPAQAILTNLGYQGVAVPPGHHRIEMNYRNPLIPIGAAISLAGLLASILVVLAAGRQEQTIPASRRRYGRLCSRHHVAVQSVGMTSRTPSYRRMPGTIGRTRARSLSGSIVTSAPRSRRNRCCSIAATTTSPTASGTGFCVRT
jgi:hypothetical protein